MKLKEFFKEIGMPTSFSDFNISKEEYMKIQNRISVFKEATNTRSNIIPTMITTFGMKEGTYSDQIIAKIDMEDLF